VLVIKVPTHRDDDLLLALLLWIKFEQRNRMRRAMPLLALLMVLGLASCERPHRSIGPR
jgi:hypothetical protein